MRLQVASIWDAAARNDVAAVKRLVSGASKEDINYRNMDQARMTWGQIVICCRPITEAFLPWANRPNKQNGATALRVACKEGFVEVVRLLLTAGAETGIRNNDVSCA
jgi:ankyrin repeat protein